MAFRIVCHSCSLAWNKPFLIKPASSLCPGFLTRLLYVKNHPLVWHSATPALVSTNTHHQLWYSTVFKLNESDSSQRLQLPDWVFVRTGERTWCVLKDKLQVPWPFCHVLNSPGVPAYQCTWQSKAWKREWTIYTLTRYLNLTCISFFSCSLYTLTIVDAHIKLGLIFKQLHNRSGYGDTVVSTVTRKQEGCGFEFTSWLPRTFLDGHGLWEELVILNS